MTTIKKIFIIQSLKTTDTLKSGVELAKKMSPIVPTDLKNVETNLEVFEYLDKIREEIFLSNENHIIHFDCHGNEDGIGLFDKFDNLSFITWEDLRDKLREIYFVSRQRLISSFSSCKGLNVVKLIAQFKPCPFELITGSFQKIGFQISVDGYHLFYSSIHQGDSIEKAMYKTRQKYPALEFAAFSKEKLAELGWKGYFNTQITPEKVKERKAQIISEVISIKGSITPQEVAFIDNGLTKEAAQKDYERYVKIFYS